MSEIGKTISAWIAVVTVLLTGSVLLVNVTQNLAHVNTQLDRNCRLIVQLDRDVRLFLLTQDGATSPLQRKYGSNVRDLLAPFDELSC